MPLPLTVSCFSKIQIGFTFLVLAHLGSPGQRAVKRVCVCVCDAAVKLSVQDGGVGAEWAGERRGGRRKPQRVRSGAAAAGSDVGTDRQRLQ